MKYVALVAVYLTQMSRLIDFINKSMLEKTKLLLPTIKTNEISHKDIKQARIFRNCIAQYASKFHF